MNSELPAPRDLEKERGELIALMESVMLPEVLEAVESAYRGSEPENPETLQITCDGTANA
jgi:hypothetical protein